jgi:hypothetical protein
MLADPLPENGAGALGANGKIDPVSPQGGNNFDLADAANLLVRLIHLVFTPCLITPKAFGL